MSTMPLLINIDRESLIEALREVLREVMAQDDVPQLTEPVYNPKRLAEMFGVSRRTVQKWHLAGELEYVLVTSKNRVSTPEQIEAFLKKKRKPLFGGQ